MDANQQATYLQLNPNTLIIKTKSPIEEWIGKQDKQAAAQGENIRTEIAPAQLQSSIP